jgi:transposase
MAPPPDESPEQEVVRLRVHVVEDAERTLTSERDILRAAAKYFAGETNW